MDENAKLGFLKDEYLLLQKFYEDFDARIITIKGWSLTIGLVAIGGGFVQSRFLWLFAVFSALICWGVEAVWKSFQYMYAPRIQELEKAFRNQSFEKIAPFQIYTSWFEALQEHGFEIFSNLRLAVVFFPHVFTAIAGIVLFGLETLGVMHITHQTK